MSINSIGYTDAQTAGFVPEDWLTAALQVVRANIVLAKYVRQAKDLGGGGFAVGDTLNIPYTGTFTAQDKTAGNPISVAKPSNSKTVSLTLSKHKTVDFLIEDFGQALADTDLMQQFMRPAAIAIVEALENDLFSMYSKVTQPSVGVVGTGIGPAQIRSMRKTMNDAKIPLDNRFLVLSDSDEISVLGDSTLQTYFAYHQTEAVSEATIGRLYGFDIYQSQLVPGFASAGTHQAQLLSNTGTVSGGTFTLTFGAQTTAAIPWNATANQVESALAALSTIGAGNVRCAFATHGSPQDSQMGALTSPAGLIVYLFTASPGAITATNTSLTGSTPAVIITDYGTSSAANANFNLALHQDAFLLAVRPFKDVPDNLGVQITQMMDPVSGITLRMGYQYDGNYRGVHGWLDILYGFTAMRPEFGLVALS